MKEYLKKYLDVINNYFSLIIAAPAVLGGLWQIVSLISIDPAFIRFFSVSQILADGLYMLIVMSSFGIIIAALLALINYSRKQGEISNEHSNEVIPEKAVEGRLEIGLLYIPLAILLGWCIYWLTAKFFAEKIDIIDFLFLPILFLVIIFEFIIILTIVYNLLTKKISLSKTVTKVFSIIFIAVACFYFYVVLEKFNSSFLMSDSLLNVENVLNKFKIPGKPNNFEILYFNDTYIFVEFEKNHKIKIIKFEEFFNEDNQKLYDEKVQVYNTKSNGRNFKFTDAEKRYIKDSLMIEKKIKIIDSLQTLTKQLLKK